MTAPSWFTEIKAEMAATLEMEWIEPDVVISGAELLSRARDGWRLINQVDSKHPRASKEYGRHWARDAHRKG